MPSIFDKKPMVPAVDHLARARARLMQNQLARESQLHDFITEAGARGDNVAADGFRRTLAKLVRDREDS